MSMRPAAAALAAFFLAACGGEGDNSAPGTATTAAPVAEVQIETIGIAEVAERFVRLGLALGQYDEAYVDAYHGPEDWRPADGGAPPLEDLKSEADALIEAVGVLRSASNDARSAMLEKQLVAAQTRIRMAMGETFTFDEETRLLYDAVAPAYDIGAFDAALAEIETLLPGDGALADRVEAFRNSLAIPADKLSAVFEAALAECRARTISHYDLPEDERFRIGYVTDKPWSGYNWYQGDFESLIEINTDFPVIIDRAVDLGCHEGYPGHHTWNILVERDFVNRNGWTEYLIYPLFSPQSLIGEGSANYGIELAFPADEKTAFEAEVLFPLAGLDPGDAEKLAALKTAMRALSHAGNHVAREYLDGRMDRETAIETLRKYGLQSRERAEQRVRFIETYRGYVINYNIGRDIVAGFIERGAADEDDRWAAFEKLLTSPISASDMTAD